MAVLLLTHMVGFTSGLKQNVPLSSCCISRRLCSEPRCEKTGLRGFRPGPTQTRLFICIFVFAYAKSRFSHNAALLSSVPLDPHCVDMEVLNGRETESAQTISVRGVPTRAGWCKITLALRTPACMRIPDCYIMTETEFTK